MQESVNGLSVTTTKTADPSEVRLEALRLAMIQAPGVRPATWTIAEALKRAKAFETYINTGTVTT